MSEIPLVQQVDYGYEYKLQQMGTWYHTNWDAMGAIMSVYSRPGMTVADVTYGAGSFWKYCDTTIYDFRPSDLKLNGIDFKSLPYDDSEIDIVVFDPPYRYTPRTNIHTHHSERYALESSLGIYRPSDVEALYLDGILECERVTKNGGFIIVKCMDCIEANLQSFMHASIMQMGSNLYAKDLIVVCPKSTVGSRHKRQRHLKKTHSYFIVFRKGGAWPFGIPKMGPPPTTDGHQDGVGLRTI